MCFSPAETERIDAFFLIRKLLGYRGLSGFVSSRAGFVNNQRRQSSVPKIIRECQQGVSRMFFYLSRPGHYSSLVCRVLCVLALFVLSGCAGRQASKDPFTFWPDADLPRIQFLMAINSNSDVVELKKGFKLVSFEAPEKVQFEPLIKPTGVAVHKGKIYVCDAGRTAVFVIDMVNKTFETLPGAVGRGSFNKPLNLDFDSDDNLYVADVNRQEILIFDTYGNFLRSIGKEAHMKPTDVGVDGDFVFVSDAKNHDIKVFNRHNDQLVDTIGQGEGMGQDKLSIPIHLDVDDDGNIHVTNTGTGRIVKLDRDGHLLQAFGGLGNVVSLFGRPRGITVDDQGFIYIVDAAHQNVQIFNEQGRLLMYFGGPGEMKLPASVTVTKENLDIFQKMAAPNFELERVVFVTNHFGNKRLAVYGLGKRRGIDYDAEYAAIKKDLEERIRKEKEEAESKKAQ